MNTLKIEDLPQSLELDRQAMTEIIGSGLWGSIKKYSKKAGRYAKGKARQRIRTYKQAYSTARSTPRTIYNGISSWF